MRKFISFLLPAAVTAMGPVLILSSTSCRKNTPVTSISASADSSGELAPNALSGLPGSVYASQASSAIKWQPWTPESFALAKKMNRMVLAVVISPQQPSYQNVLNDLSGDAEVTKAINENYVPVLVDVDTAREMQMISGDLCTQLKKPIQFPLFVWLSPEGNPVGWLPIQGKTAEINVHTFNGIETVVADMRNSADGYIEKNSTADQETRRARILKTNVAEASKDAPDMAALASLRQLISLYDVGSRNLDNSGSLVPSAVIDTLASASLLPGIPAELRHRSKQTTAYLLEDYLQSPMFDPLDGGVFSAHQGKSATLPFFERDTTTQARMAVALFHAYAATGDALALERALGCIAFAEKNYATTDGLFSYGLASAVPIESWLWKMDDLEKLLFPEDAAWWAKLTGMQSMGNIPLEADAKRAYFRMNLQSLKKTFPALAKDSGLTEPEFQQKFDKIRQTLLTDRSQRQAIVYKDKEAHAGATFRMISAYAAAYTATGDAKFLEKATQVLERAKTTFSAGELLNNYAGTYAPALSEGRAFLYGLAIQSALDVADISGDQKSAKWAEQLTAKTAQLFVENGFVRECPASASVIDLPVADRTMLFDDSSIGLLASAAQRLQARGLAVPEALSTVLTPFPKDAAADPITHTDVILVNLVRGFSPTLVLGDQAAAELTAEAGKLPLRLVNRRAALPADQIAADGAKWVPVTGDATPISSAKAVREGLLPSP